MRRLLNALLVMSLFAIASCAAPPTDAAQAATPTHRTPAPQPEPKRVEAPAPVASGDAVKLRARAEEIFGRLRGAAAPK